VILAARMVESAGIAPQLAALETIVYPSSAQLQATVAKLEAARAAARPPAKQPKAAVPAKTTKAKAA